MSYQKKFLEDGTINPKWKPDTRKRGGDRHKNRAHEVRPRKRPVRNFCAWDGEGADGEYLGNGKTKHFYFLLANSDGDILQTAKNKNLKSSEILDFLCDKAQQQQNVINIIFGGGYDFTHILKGLPPEVVDEATHKDYALHYADGKRYKIRCIPNKYLYIKREYIRRAPSYEGGELTGYKHIGVEAGNFQLWDVFGFFNSSFVEAIKTWLPSQKEKIAQIEKMKARRDNFKNIKKADIIAYNALECELLCLLMEEFRKQLSALGITLRRWDGAGALAVAFLQKNGVKASCRAEDSFPEEIKKALRHAYAGGRAELGRYGTHSGRVWNYDIHSAYPAVMATLPDLEGGMWQRVTGEEVTDTRICDFALYEIEWNMQGIMYAPFPYRLKNQCIEFPAAGRGIYWGAEINAAMEALNYYKSDDCKLEGYKTISRRHNWYIKIIKGWEFLPASNKRPFAWVEDLYNERQKLKKIDANKSETIKAALVNLYGKLVQTAGAAADRLPPYYSITYGGFITAKTRAEIYKAIYKQPQDVIFIATDGLFSSAPLELETPEGKPLGKWGLAPEAINNLVIVQSGFYIVSGKDGNGNYIIGRKTRGILPDEFAGKTAKETREKTNAVIRRIWDEWRTEKPEEEKRLKFRTGQFLGIYQSLINKDWDNAGNREEGERELILTPKGTKRADDTEIYNPLGGIIYPLKQDRTKELRTTRPVKNYLYEEGGGVLSYPYCRPWDEDTLCYTKEIEGMIINRKEIPLEREKAEEIDIAYYRTLL